MIEESPHLQLPEASAQAWRYMSFTKFVSLIARSELYFLQLGGRLRSQGAGSRLRFGWARRCSMSRIMASLTMVSETSGSSS